ncbi:hypothetical protein [Mycobacteroides abscessus]|uniref:hypothetical protein n=1 Tax=Mycobacteroides abscessus TaxID=36809 RepID=UPI001A96D292|nr:hypothetical protein [Mycobacteroides abscessus]
MSDSGSSQAISGLGGMILFGILAMMKICPWENPVQDWSWWWVTAPLWGPLALAVAIGLVAGMVWLVAKSFEAVSK